jgi:hypothetical protein
MKNTMTTYRDSENGIISEKDYIRVQGYNGWFDLCPMNTVFQSLVFKWVAGQSGNIIRFLRQAGVSIAADLPYDLDGDGDQDWVIARQNPWEDYVEVWALVVDDSGFTPLRTLLSVTVPGSGLSQDYFKVETVQLPGNAAPINFLSAADELAVFQLVYNGERPPYLQVLSSLNGVKDYAIQDNGETFEFKAYFTPDRWSPNWQVYRWAPAYYRFDPVKREASEEEKKYYGPDDAAQAAEEKLVKEWDPAAAIPLLKDVLATPRGEQEGFWCYGSAYCLNRIRLYYLLALAYDLTGDEASAVQTYWQLWRDYPASPYALMARAKLDPIAP